MNTGARACVPRPHVHSPWMCPQPRAWVCPTPTAAPTAVPTFSFWNPLVEGLTTSWKLGQGLGGRLPPTVTARHPPPSVLLPGHPSVHLGTSPAGPVGPSEALGPAPPHPRTPQTLLFRPLRAGLRSSPQESGEGSVHVVELLLPGVRSCHGQGASFAGETNPRSTCRMPPVHIPGRPCFLPEALGR